MDLQRRIPKNKTLNFGFRPTETAFFSLFQLLICLVVAQAIVTKVVELCKINNFA